MEPIAICATLPFPSPTGMDSGLDSSANHPAAQDAQPGDLFNTFNPHSLGFEPPRASFLVSAATTPRDSYVQTPDNSSPLLPASENPEKGGAVYEAQDKGNATPKRRRSTRILFFAFPICLIILAAAVVLPIYFLVIKPGPRAASSAGSDGGGPGFGSPTSTGAITGGDGSVVTTDNGSTFIYNNPFGGFCE
jgi:glucan 1,3-beta-glucosidase